MLNTIRYKIANILIKMAKKSIEKGGFKNILRGLEYMKWSVMVVPPSKELHDFAIEMRKEVEKHKAMLES